MPISLPGLHHVTAITADAQRNIDFYCGVLGLRLVKVTDNFDDPASYHLYYGDTIGRAGSVMTFFVWPGGHRGRIGPPQVVTTAFAAPSGSLPFWQSRLGDSATSSQRLGEQALGFFDPDGLPLEIVEAEAAGDFWQQGGIPAETAIRGFRGVTLSEEGHETTARMLTGVMGFAEVAHEGNRFRYRAEAGQGATAATVDVLCMPDARQGTLGAGVVHHVAFRTADDVQQAQWRERLLDAEANVTPVMDRKYFHSIYFREPGGVLFEIATENPGFAVDEAAAELGGHLMLPAIYEPHRARIQQLLPSIRLPSGVMLPSGGKSA